MFPARWNQPVVKKVVRHPLDRVQPAVADRQRVALEVRDLLHFLDHLAVLIQRGLARHRRDHKGEHDVEHDQPDRGVRPVIDRSVGTRRNDDHEQRSRTDLSRTLTRRGMDGTFQLDPATKSNPMKFDWIEILIVSAPSCPES